MAKIATAVLELSTDATKYHRGLVDAEQRAQAFSLKAVAMGTAIGSALGNLAVAGAKRLGSALAEIASRGFELAPTVRSFGALTAAIGESGEAMLQAGRAGSKGLVSDLEMIGAANKALLLGLPITASSFGMLAQTAVVLGKAMGAGPTQSFNDLITALGRSSPMILDNLGLSVQVGAANEAYARSVGKTADQLTDAEKKLAFYNAALEAAKQKVTEIGGLHLTLADQVTRVETSFTNFTDALGVAIATSPVLNAAFGGLGDALEQALGGNQTALVLRLTKAVGAVAITVVDLAQVGLTGAGIFGRAWSGLQMVFAGTASVLTSVGLAVANVVASAAELAAKIPGVGSQFQGLAYSARDMATFMGGVQQSFHDQAEEAWQGVQGNSAFQRTLDSVSGSLSTMRARMADASKQSADAADIAARLTQHTGTVGESAAAAAERIKQEAASLKALTKENRDLERAIAARMKVHRQSYEVLEEARGLTAVPALQGGRNTQLAALDTFSSRLAGSLQQDLPSAIMGAIQGGGSIFKAAGSTLGQFLTSEEGFGGQISKGLTKLLGAGLGGAVNALVPGLGALMGPALEKLVGGIKKLFGGGGPSEAELAGREESQRYQDALLQGLTTAQYREAAGTDGFISDNEKWKATIIAVRDQYVQAGRSIEDAEAMVKRLWDAEKAGPAAVRAVRDEIDAVVRAGEDAAAAASEAVAATQRQIEEISSARMSAAEAELTTLLDSRKELAAGLAKEADEETKGVIQLQQEAELQNLDAQLEAKSDAYAQLALETGQAMADAIVKALEEMELPILHVGAVVDPIGGGVPPVIPMAAGGFGRVTGPTLFYSAGQEDFAFSGEGRRFSGATSDMSAGLAGVQQSIDALRRDIGSQVGTAVVHAMARYGVRA